MTNLTNGNEETQSLLQGSSVNSYKELDLKHKRNLYAFWLYSFAAEVFAVVSLTLFLPITLEQYARENGRKLPDKVLPCITDSMPGPPPTQPPEQERCVVELISGHWVDTASFSMYVYSASVLIQALVVITMGGVADDAKLRKPLLVSFAITGSIATILFFFVTPDSPAWPIVGLLAIISNVCFGASFVLLNSYLGLLARRMPQCIAKEPHNFDPLDPDEQNESQQDHDAHIEYARVLSQTTSFISARGIAAGYGGGVIMVLFSLIPVSSMGGSTFALRIAISASGLWWLAFTIPSAAWLPSYHSEIAYNHDRPKLYLLYSGWASLFHMLGQVKRLKNTFIFLLAWFLLSDGFTTITSTAILFAKTALGMESSTLIFVGVLTPSGGLVGSLVWPKIQNSRFFKRLASKKRRQEQDQDDSNDAHESSSQPWSNMSILILLVALASFIPVYGCIGFIPWIRDKAPFGGLTKPGEIYVFAIYFGFLYGGFQSYARTCFSEIIPAGHEARWFGLYSITDKSSSFIGPLVVGLIADTTGSIRLGFFFLAFIILVPIFVLSCIDMEKGRQDAHRFAKEEPSSFTY